MSFSKSSRVHKRLQGCSSGVWVLASTHKEGEVRRPKVGFDFNANPVLPRLVQSLESDNKVPTKNGLGHEQTEKENPSPDLSTCPNHNRIRKEGKMKAREEKKAWKEKRRSKGY